MNKEDFVTYEQAVKLEELGFNEEVFFHFNSETKEIAPIEGASYSEGGPFDTYDVLEDVTKYGLIPAPTLSQAQKWLREVKGIIILIEPMYDKNRIAFNYAIFTFKDKHITIEQSYKVCVNYEEALSDGIDKALELIINENGKDS